MWQTKVFWGMDAFAVEVKVNKFLEEYKDNILIVSNLDLKKFGQDDFVVILLFKWRV